MLLEVLDCRVGRSCQTHTDYKHFRPANGWRVREGVKGFLLHDTAGRKRLRLYTPDDQPPRLTALPYYQPSARWEHWKPGWAYLSGVIVTAEGDEVYNTYAIVDQTLITRKMVEGYARYTAQLFKTIAPDLANPFAYWE